MVKKNGSIDSALTYKIESGNNDEVMKCLMEVGIDALDNFLRTSLMWASYFGNISLLIWLIENGADVNHRDKNGYSALHFAGQEKRFECAKLLIDKGANLETTDHYGNTPLWTAIFNSNGYIKVVELFIQRGANPDHLNKFQRTPRQIAEILEGFKLSCLDT